MHRSASRISGLQGATPRATPRATRFARAAARAVVVGAFALVLAAGARAQQTDELETKDGKKVSGTVQKADYDLLQFKSKQGAQLKVAWGDVVKLKLGGPVDFNEVVDKVGSAPVDDSLAGLEKLKGDAKLREPLKQEVLFLLASVRARKGDLDGSIAGWQDLLKAFPSGRYLDVAIRGVVEGMLAKGQAAEAGKALDAAAGEAKAANPGPRFDASVKLLQARILEAQNKIPEAKTAYDGVEKSGSLAPDQAAVANLGVARCLQSLGQNADAEARYRKIVATTTDVPRYVLAGAWNGIGDMILKTAREKRDTDQLVVALLAFLRGASQYLPLEGEPTNEHMRALDSAVLACESIGQVDAANKALYTQRAATLREQRKRLYGAPTK
jgi:tetratricopeptide (TPR) repeat protein